MSEVKLIHADGTITGKQFEDRREAIDYYCSITPDGVDVVEVCIEDA